MDVSVGSRRESSFEEREAEPRAPRTTPEAPIAAGGEVGDAELDEAPAECDAGPAREGVGA